MVGEGRGAARWRRALGARTRQRVCAHRPVRAHVAVRIVSTRGMSERAGRRRATFSSRAWRRSFADFLEHEETKRGLSEFEPRLTHGARFAAMAPPARQDPIPGSYIRECVTKEGAHRWNVRAYDAATRATVTLGTFGNLAEAKGAYWAHEKKAAAPEKKPSSSPNPPRTKTAPEEAARAKKPTARSKTARKREPVAPPPSAKRAPKKGAVNTPAKKRPAAKGEKRPRAGKAPSSPRAPKRRRSSAADHHHHRDDDHDHVAPADPSRLRAHAQPRRSRRARHNLGQQETPTKKTRPTLPDKPQPPRHLPAPPTASFGKNHAMKRQSPRLASPRSPRPRRRSKGGHVIWSPQAQAPVASEHSCAAGALRRRRRRRSRHRGRRAASRDEGLGLAHDHPRRDRAAAQRRPPRAALQPVRSRGVAEELGTDTACW